MDDPAEPVRLKQPLEGGCIFEIELEKAVIGKLFALDQLAVSQRRPFDAGVFQSRYLQTDVVIVINTIEANDGVALPGQSID